jgi:hypothetical protein
MRFTAIHAFGHGELVAHCGQTPRVWKVSNACPHLPHFQNSGSQRQALLCRLRRKSGFGWRSGLPLR